MIRSKLLLAVMLVVAPLLFCSCDNDSYVETEQITQKESHGSYTAGWHLIDNLGNKSFQTHVFSNDNTEPVVDLPDGFEYTQQLGLRRYDPYGIYTIADYYNAYFSAKVEWDQTDYQKTDSKGKILVKHDFKNITLTIALVYVDEDTPSEKAPDLSFVGTRHLPDQIGEWTPKANGGYVNPSKDPSEYYFQYSVDAIASDGSKAIKLYLYVNCEGEWIACTTQYSVASYSNGYLVHRGNYIYIGTTKYEW